jgi:hypothetical protein
MAWAVLGVSPARTNSSTTVGGGGWCAEDPFMATIVPEAAGVEIPP